MMDINLEWYRCFYKIAQTGSLTKAAEQLHITQPAVSQTVKQLEEKMGGPLFIRTPRGVQLTREGEVLLRYIEHAFLQIESGEKAIAEMNNLNAGEIHIGASDTLCSHYLLPYLEQFHQRYPGVRIRIANRTTPETIALLKQGVIDCGIVSLPVAAEGVDIRRSAPLRDCLVGGERYRRLAEAPLTLGRLREHPLLMLEPGGSTRQAIDAYAEAHGVALQPEFELGSIDLLVQFAVRGFGLAFVIRDYAAEQLGDGRLVEIPLDPPLPERSIGIATMRGTPLSAASKAFLELLP